MQSEQEDIIEFYNTFEVSEEVEPQHGESDYDRIERLAQNVLQGEYGRKRADREEALGEDYDAVISRVKAIRQTK